MLILHESLRRQFEEFIQLTDKEFEYVCNFFYTTRLKKHSLVVQIGDVVDREYFVVKGLLKTFMIDTNGKEHILQFAMENWWVSDYEALNTDKRSSFNIECLEEVELLYLSLADKNRLCEEMHQMERFFRMKTTSGFLSLQKRVIALMKNDAQSRYKQLYEQYPMLFNRVTKSMIAAYLGVSRETLSRLTI